MDATSDKRQCRYRVGDLVLDRASGQVTREGQPLTLTGLTYDMLLALVDAAPTVLTYDELCARVWGGRLTTPETIAQRAKMLRHALADDARSPRYFELIRGQGYRLVVDVKLMPPARDLQSKPARKVFALVAMAALGIVVAVVYLMRANDPSRSLAVLPFEDLSPRGDQRYLADGIVEELISTLSRLDGLEVASRTESFYYRGPSADLREVGSKLGVSAVLEGSVRKSGDRLRITVQLINVVNGFHLWSDSFDRELRDVFDIQRDIATAVAGALGVKLGVGGVNEFRGAGTVNFDAYQAYLQGDYKRAIALDPGYAAAWARRGLRIASTMWEKPPEEAPSIMQRALYHAEKAVELDPTSARVATDFATLIYVTLDWDRAQGEYERALSLQRSESNLLHFANMLTRVGRTGDAMEVYRERRDMLRVPDEPQIHLINALIALKRYDEAASESERSGGTLRQYTQLLVALNRGAVDEIRQAVASVPPASPGYADLYLPIVEVLDSPPEALALLEESMSDNRTSWPSKYADIALLAAYLGYPEFAFEVFLNELRYTTIRFGTLWIPVMAEVRRLPAFKQFVIDVELVDYWKKHSWGDFCRPRGQVEFICN